MGNVAAGRRGSVLSKESSITDGKPSRQNTLAEDSPPEPLSETQKADLTRTWKLLEDDIAKVGVITFISLFETHPDVQQVFMPFSGIELEDLKHSKQLRAHALRVMAFVQKCISRLNEPEKLEQLLRELGKKHHSYKAKAKYVDLVGPQFIQAIQPSLGEEWTEEVSAAWVLLFAHIGYTMKGAMNEAAEEAKMKQ